MKIIMISLDSLRAKRLSSYGYTKPTSPYIDKIASEGVLFEKGLCFRYPNRGSTYLDFHWKDRTSQWSRITWIGVNNSL
ncbi:hypothetical protein GCM10020331_060800 [Ectobacillus funiculus]